MTRDKILSKLRHLKILAEQGVGGEATGAQSLYEKISKKYDISDEELQGLELEKVEKRWFKYKDELSKKLATQVFYKVTGSTVYWVRKDKRFKEIGVECTQLEYDEILFYYNFYMGHFRKELDIFFRAFVNANDIFPNASARLYEGNDDNDSKLTKEELDRLSKVFNMARNMEKHTPHKQLEQKQ